MKNLNTQTKNILQTAKLLLAAFCFMALPVTASADVSLAGDMTNWGSNMVAMPSSGTNTYMLDYYFSSSATNEFKIVEDGSWYANGGTISNSGTASGLTTSGGNMKFTHGVGIYRFVYDSSSKSITISSVVVADNDVRMMGDLTDWDNGATFTYQGDNIFVYDHEFSSSGTTSLKFKENGIWLGDYGGSATTSYKCNKYKTGYNLGGNISFTHNAGKYRFFYDATPDIDGSNSIRYFSVTGISVETPTAKQNSDGSFTITAEYANANGSNESITTRQIVFTTYDSKVGVYNTATDNGDGTFSYTTPVLTEGYEYTCYARVVSGTVGDLDSDPITFTPEASNTLTSSVNDASMGTMTVTCEGTTLASGADLTNYIGKTVTVTLTPASMAYDANTISVNGTEYAGTLSNRVRTYSFTYNGGALSIIGNLAATTASLVELRGDMNNWKQSDTDPYIYFTNTSGNIFVLDYTFSEAATGKFFKLYEDNANWVGYGDKNGDLTASYGLKATTLTQGDAANIGISYKAGKYRFTYNNSTNVLSITGVFVPDAPTYQLNSNGTYTITVPYETTNGDEDEVINSVTVEYTTGSGTTGSWTATKQSEGVYVCTTPFLTAGTTYNISSLVKTEFITAGIASDASTSFTAAGSTTNQLSTSVNDASMGSITVTSSDGTTIAAGDISAYLGQTLTIKLTPNTGYNANSISVNGSVLTATTGTDGSLTATYAYEGDAMTVVGSLSAGGLSISKDDNCTVSVVCGSTTLNDGDPLAAYVGQTISITVTVTDENVYRVASLTVNGTQEAFSDNSLKTYTKTITLENANLSVEAKSAAVCLAHTIMTLSTETGFRCSESGGSTNAHLKMNVLNGFTYTLSNNSGSFSDTYVCTESENQRVFTVTAGGTYTMTATQTTGGCGTITMDGNPTITDVTSTMIGNDIVSTLSGGTVYPYQLRTFETNTYNVDWVLGDGTSTSEAIIVAESTRRVAVKYKTAGNYTIYPTMLDDQGAITACKTTESFNIINPTTEECIE